jgi:hypothetical protein
MATKWRARFVVFWLLGSLQDARWPALAVDVGEPVDEARV